MDINEFHFMLGQTIMYCQIIEHDVKMIYAAMHNGDMRRTLREIERKKWTLGATIENLKRLDLSDGNAYISLEDYEFLQDMTDKRNHWCHDCYINFIYERDIDKSVSYSRECVNLRRDNAKLGMVYKMLENVRVRAMEDFGRT